MTTTDFLFSLLPLFLLATVMVIVIKKSGLFQQRAHRERVEALLERIAIAIEKDRK